MEGMYLAIVIISTLLVFISTSLLRFLRSSQDLVTYPVLGTLPSLLWNKHRVLEWATELLIRAPGNTITFKRPGFHVVRVTANFRTVEHILKTNFENYPKGEFISQTLEDLLGQGIFNVNDALWKIQRKVASFEFTTRSLQDFIMETLTFQVDNKLLPTIESVSGKPLDLQDLLQRFTFDSICKVAFGVDPRCLDPSFPRVDVVDAFDEATRLTAERFYEVHPLLWKMKRALNFGSEKRLKEAVATVDRFAETVIRNRRQALASSSGSLKDTPTDHQDLLSRFMAVQMTDWLGFDDNHPAFDDPDKFLRDIVISFMLAGRDTTSVALSWFFWLISNHPRVEQLIIKEVDSVSVSSTGFSYNELKEMNYLHAALTESLRLYPSVPATTKVASRRDVLPDGTVVEAGMRVAYHIYAMGRLESLWGKDCMEYKPERWLKDGSFVGESPYKFPVFNGGPRICLGKDMAMLQMKFVAAALIRKFKFTMLRPEKQPRYVINLTLPMRDGLQVIPELR